MIFRYSKRAYLIIDKNGIVGGRRFSTTRDRPERRRAARGAG